MIADFVDGYTEEVSEACPEGRGVTLKDFCAYMPLHVYIFTPCREIWPGSSVNARLPRVQLLDKQGKPRRNKQGKLVTVTASHWLDQNRPVEQMTWCPGLPMLIPDRLVSDGGWMERKDVTCFNLYRPPRIEPGDAGKAEPWIEHVHKLLDDNDARHSICWLAHRVQLPQEKINHALVLGGPQGIGKDSMLEPIKQAIGPWNFHEISPSHLLGRFNGFAKSVILRVNEARDLGEVNRFSFYDHTKIYTAAPPDVLRVDEKHLREHYVFNCLGLIVTTNHKSDGIFLPPDDRRHYVAWSNRSKDDFPPGYWKRLWGWYSRGGFQHVAAYLAEFDLSDFDAKAPPPKTPAFWDIVNAGCSPEDAELADVLDALGNPDAVTLPQLIAAASNAATEWLMDRKNRRAVPHRMERCGYVPIRNPEAADGLWKLQKARQVIYVKADLGGLARGAAVKKLMAQ
jgi:uncharacterized protein DUF5906